MYLLFLFASTIVFAAVVAVYLRHPARSWYHPLSIYLIYHFIAFCVRPWLSHLLSYDAVYRGYHFEPDEYARNMALVVSSLGLAVFAAASLWQSKTSLLVNLAGAPPRERFQRSFLVIFAILLPLFLYSIYLGWQYRMTDGVLMLRDRQTGIAISVGTNGYVMGAVNMAVLLLPVLCWLFRFRVAVLVPTVMLLFLMLGTGSRGSSICAIFALSCFYLFDRRRRWFDWRIPVGAALLFVVFNAVGDDRGRAVRNLFTDDLAEAWTNPYEDQPLEGMDFASMEFVEYLTWVVPRKTGTFEYFVGQLQLLTEPIPRALWPDKPIGQPIQMFDLYDYGFPIGMTRSLPGEGWVQFGLVGVIVWCGLWGLALGRFHQWTADGRKTPFHLALYFSILALMIVCYRDGLLLSVARFGLFAIVPLGLWLFLSRLLGEDQNAVRARADTPLRKVTARAHRNAPARLLPRARR